MAADKQKIDTVNIKNNGDNVTILINNEPALAYSKAEWEKLNQVFNIIFGHRLREAQKSINDE